MKKAVAHLIPFMEKEKNEMYAKMIAEGKQIKIQVFVHIHAELLVW